MENIENTVAAMEPENAGDAAEQLADDAQATEVSVEEVIANLQLGGEGAEKVENEGDDSHSAQETPAQMNKSNRQGEGKGRQIAAALKQQRQDIFKDLGMSEDAVRELIRTHKASELAKENPDVSPTAARMIIEAREQASAGGIQVTDAHRNDIRALYAAGWTKDQLLAFTQDERTMNDVRNGMSVRDAALAYAGRMGGRQAEPQGEPEDIPVQKKRKSGVPSAAATAAGSAPEPNPIEHMSEAQYDRFMKDLRKRAMRGEKVRV